MLNINQTSPNEVVSDLAVRISRILAELREMTTDFTVPFERLVPARQNFFLVNAGKLNAYADALNSLGLKDVSLAILKLEFHGVENYMNVVTRNVTQAYRDEPSAGILREAVDRRRGDWKEPPQNLEIPADKKAANS